VKNLDKQRVSEWKTIRIRQELVAAAKRTLKEGRYRSLSEFVSEALRLRLDELKQGQKTAEKHADYPVIRERLLHNSNHVWAMVTPEGNVRVGLSGHAQRRLKGIAGIQTHAVGYETKKGEPFGVVETWMFMFDLYSPVSGRITKINRLLQNDPSIINSDPYETGWIVEIKPNNVITLEAELRELMRLPEYAMWASKQGPPRILSL
jgi:glycine cleavage system H protein